MNEEFTGSTQERLTELYKTFNNEFVCDYEIRRHRNNKYSIFAEYLSGLPSCLDIPYENYYIIELEHVDAKE